MRKIRHLDCFSGVGGIATGFNAANIITAAAIEKVSSCTETYAANHVNVPVINKDIRKVTSKRVKELCGDNVEIISAGIPCETFSTAGSKSRSFYDHRQILYKQVIRFAKVLNSPLIMFENVPAITTKKISRDSDILVIDKIRHDLKRAGYFNIAEFVLNAVDYGVPQIRERFFLLASKFDSFNLVQPKIVTDKHFTVKDAFAGLPKVQSNRKYQTIKLNGSKSEYMLRMRDSKFWHIKDYGPDITYHQPPNHRERTLERFKLIKQGEGLKDLFNKYSERKVKELQEKKILPNKWYIQRNRRLRADFPSHAVTSHCLDEMVHPTENRALTVREVARLQSFPDSYQFVGGPVICPHLYETQDKYEQIGDAVPPLMSYQWAKTIKKLFK